MSICMAIAVAIAGAGGTLRAQDIEKDAQRDLWPAAEELPVVEELPDPLVMFDGTPVTSAEQWRSERRAELISLIEHYMFGKAPPAPDNFSYTVEDVDERFAVVIPHQSGQGGAAPARNISSGAESLERVNRVFPHWFNAVYGDFGSQVERLPFDSHSLIALCAPRAVLLTNAAEDSWADPRRQFDALAAAVPVYELHGIENPLGSDAFPKQNELVDSVLGYWIRAGGHSIEESDWDAWMDFADKHFQ